MGSNEIIMVVGKVVGICYSCFGNLWFNFDKQFFNQIFFIFICKKDLVNFDFDFKVVFEN